jgi:hypothetical protein
MRNEYLKIRLKDLKEMSKDFKREKKKDEGYEEKFSATAPIFDGSGRNGPFAMWFKEKLKRIDL